MSSMNEPRDSSEKVPLLMEERQMDIENYENNQSGEKPNRTRGTAAKLEDNGRNMKQREAFGLAVTAIMIYLFCFL